VLNAVGDEGVPVREIAEAIGRHLDLPAKSLPAGEYEGMLVHLLSTDMPASSTITQELLGWKPTHPGLIEDIEQGHYFRCPPQDSRRDNHPTVRAREPDVDDPLIVRELQQARRYIQQAHDTADSGASERDALVLMTTPAETYEALDTSIRTRGRLPTEWISEAE